jgi:hypothetical protein
MERGAPDRKVRSLFYFRQVSFLRERGMGIMAKLALLGVAALFGLMAWLSLKTKKRDDKN